jgi:hypothetical protein
MKLKNRISILKFIIVGSILFLWSCSQKSENATIVVENKAQDIVGKSLVFMNKTRRFMTSLISVFVVNPIS